MTARSVGLDETSARRLGMFRAAEDEHAVADRIVDRGHAVAAREIRILLPAEELAVEPARLPLATNRHEELDVVDPDHTNPGGRLRPEAAAATGRTAAHRRDAPRFPFSAPAGITPRFACVP